MQLKNVLSNVLNSDSLSTKDRFTGKVHKDSPLNRINLKKKFKEINCTNGIGKEIIQFFYGGKS